MEKQGKKPMHESTDRFMKLPSGLLYRILALLPMKTTVQTSVLSKAWQNQWKELWKYATDLEFGEEFASTLSREAYADFLETILQLHEGEKIEKFQLFFSPGIDYRATTKKWIELVIAKEVQELDLNFRGDTRRYAQNVHIRPSFEHRYLPNCFYTSSSLTSLKLTCCSFIPPANFNGFCSLKILYLRGMKISGESICAIVCTSPLLEDLGVEGCGPLDAMKINSLRMKRLAIDCCWHANKTEVFAPNLQNLYFVGRLSETPVLTDVSLLSDATVHVLDEFGFLGGSLWVRFLACLSHVRKLDLIPKSFPAGVHSAPIVTFHNLRELHLHCLVNLGDSYDIGMFFTCFSFPRMEKLTILIPSGNLVWLADSRRIHGPDTPSRFEFKRLKEIKITNFFWRVHVMKLVEFLLGRTPVLEMLVLEFPLRSIRGKLVEAPPAALCNQLCRIPKASAEARIVISGYNKG